MYPFLHINACSTAALAKAVRSEHVDSILIVTLRLPDAPTACCHLQHISLTFSCPICGDREVCVLTMLFKAYTMNSHGSRPTHATQVYPLYAFTFIRTFLSILIEYFGEVIAPVLRDNFDIVRQLL